MTLTRRGFLYAAAASTALPVLSSPLRAAEVRGYSLKAAPGPVQLAPLSFPPTKLWTYNGVNPGPEIRVRQGERVRIVVENGLDRETSVHWHGLRIPHAMDGVPYLSQPPIEPGGRFVYDFTPPDAGTFWYHPHLHSVVQTNMGLYGMMVVEEREPLKVDRELSWVLGDWRLGTDGQIRDNFASTLDYLRAGRIGNTVTVNGQVGGGFEFRAGERVRIRLLNACDARIFALKIPGHTPTVIALDGQPVEPFVPVGGAIVLGPAQRADIVLDLEHRPGDIFQVIDTAMSQDPYILTEMVYSSEPALRASPLNSPIRLPANPVPAPDLGDPVVWEVDLEGGEMGRLGKAKVDGIEKNRVEMLALGRMWAINGIASFHNHNTPMFTVKRGRTVVINFHNRTVWPHPMHLHGHSFKVLRHDGVCLQNGHTVDTVLLGGGENCTVAFVADNPGDWMMHCHILGHSDSGMMTTYRVT